MRQKRMILPANRLKNVFLRNHRNIRLFALSTPKFRQFVIENKTPHIDDFLAHSCPHTTTNITGWPRAEAHPPTPTTLLFYKISGEILFAFGIFFGPLNFGHIDTGNAHFPRGLLARKHLSP